MLWTLASALFWCPTEVESCYFIDLSSLIKIICTILKMWQCGYQSSGICIYNMNASLPIQTNAGEREVFLGKAKHKWATPQNQMAWAKTTSPKSYMAMLWNMCSLMRIIFKKLKWVTCRVSQAQKMTWKYPSWQENTSHSSSKDMALPQGWVKGARWSTKHTNCHGAYIQGARWITLSQV